MPRARPRAATSVNTACSSGCSPSSAANSSTTITSRGSVHPRIEDVARPDPGELRLAPAHLGAQALDRPSCSRAVQIGDDARDVRHPGEGVERGAALEVGEQEAHLAASCASAHSARIQVTSSSLLPGPGDARDDGVRTRRRRGRSRTAPRDSTPITAGRAPRVAAAAELEQRAERDRRQRVARRPPAPQREHASSCARYERLRTADGLRRRPRAPRRRRRGAPRRASATVSATPHPRRSRGRRARRARSRCRRRPRSARPVRPSASCRPAVRTAMRQMLGPGVLAAQRTDDPQLAGRQRHAQLQRPAPARPRSRAPDCRPPRCRMPPARRPARRRAARRECGSRADAASSPPPVTRTLARIGARAHDDHPSPAGDRSPDLAVRARRTRRRPDAAPSAARAHRRAARSDLAGSRARARRAPSRPRFRRSLRAPAGAVEQRRSRDQRAEGGEPERQHRARHEPQCDGAEHRHDRRERAARRAATAGSTAEAARAARRAGRTRDGARPGLRAGRERRRSAPSQPNRSRSRAHSGGTALWMAARELRLGRSRRPRPRRARRRPPSAPRRPAR